MQKNRFGSHVDDFLYERKLIAGVDDYFNGVILCYEYKE